MPEVLLELDAARKISEELNIGLDKLIKRLDPALRPVNPVEGCDEQKPQIPATQIGNNIRSLSNGISRACTIVNDILKRLEV